MTLTLPQIPTSWPRTNCQKKREPRLAQLAQSFLDSHMVVRCSSTNKVKLLPRHVISWVGQRQRRAEHFYQEILRLLTVILKRPVVLSTSTQSNQHLVCNTHAACIPDVATNREYTTILPLLSHALLMISIYRQIWTCERTSPVNMLEIFRRRNNHARFHHVTFTYERCDLERGTQE